MADRQTRTRQVSFYEILQESKDNQPHVRLSQQQDWPSLVAQLSQAQPADRLLTGPIDTLIGTTITWDDVDHLQLARVQTSDEWIQRWNKSQGEIEDIIDTDDSPFVASSIVCFLPFGNIIGVIEATRSSPRSTQIEDWINGKGWVTSPIVVSPVVGSDAIVKLNEATEVSHLELTARGQKLIRLAQKPGRLGSMFREAREIGDGDVTVKMIITASRARKKPESREGLRQELVEIADELDTGGAAKAKLVYVDASDEARTEEVNFLRRNVTAKAEVRATDDEGKPIRAASAVRAILDVADDLEPLLRNAVGLPPKS
jgi:hypothetical protein